MKSLIRFVIKILVMAGVIALLPYAISGITVGDVKIALIVALVIALINVLIKPIVSLITLPLNIVTLGLFGLIINALLFMSVPKILAVFDIGGFYISSFWPAFWGALILSIFNWLLSRKR